MFSLFYQPRGLARARCFAELALIRFREITDVGKTALVRDRRDLFGRQMREHHIRVDKADLDELFKGTHTKALLELLREA